MQNIMRRKDEQFKTTSVRVLHTCIRNSLVKNFLYGESSLFFIIQQNPY